MIDLIAALERLTRAVDRLERAAASHLPRCREDRQHAAAELSEARDELARLGGLSELLSERLEASIGKLQRHLGR